MRKTAVVLGSALVLVLAVALVRSLLVPSVTPSLVAPVAAGVVAGAAERLAGAVRIPTVSYERADDLDAAAFRALHEYLARQFPRTHSALLRETVSEHSLLYTWEGSEPVLKPVLLTGHLDVVPVEPGTEPAWQVAPFSGLVAEDFVWGRGSIDDKAAVLGLLEAVEMLLAEGFVPRRTVFLAFGHDEELGGMRGAREIAELLRRRGARLEMVVDEGGVLADGIVPRVARPVALVGTAEKGYVSIELTTVVSGGHSSLPPPQGAIGILAAAVARIEAEPMPARLDGATRQLLERISPELPLLQRAALANLWIAEPLVIRRLERNSSTSAMVRTTAAVTMFEAGTKENVLPSRARAVVNFRIAPGDSIAAVLSHVSRVVDDSRVEAKVVGSFSAEPSRTSGADSAAFRALEQAILAVVPDAVVAPHLVVVVTDARHYEPLSDNVLRFLPLRLAPDDLPRVHGANERIAIRDYERGILFYRELIENAAH